MKIYFINIYSLSICFVNIGWTKKNLLEWDLNLQPLDGRAGALPTAPILAVSLFCQYLCSGGASQKSSFCRNELKIIMAIPFMIMWSNHWGFQMKYLRRFNKRVLKPFQTLKCYETMYVLNFFNLFIEVKHGTGRT